MDTRHQHWYYTTPLLFPRQKILKILAKVIGFICLIDFFTLTPLQLQCSPSCSLGSGPLLVPLPGILMSQQTTRLTPSSSLSYCLNVTFLLPTLWCRFITPSTSYPTFLFNFSSEVRPLLILIFVIVAPHYKFHEGKEFCVYSLLYLLYVVWRRHSGIKKRMNSCNCSPAPLLSGWANLRLCSEAMKMGQFNGVGANTYLQATMF